MQTNDEHNLKIITGEHCSPECFYGTKNSDDVCVCVNGYWNTSCDQACPGGTTNPCSGEGNCEQTTGSCNCPVNLQGAGDCSVCSHGWLSDDCSISENKNQTSSNREAFVAQLGYMHNLDGLSFLLRNAGEYNMLAVSDNLLIQAKLVGCYHNFTCITFIGIRAGDVTNGFAQFTMQANQQDTTSIAVYVAGDQESLDEPKYYHGFYIQRRSIQTVEMVVNNDIVITIHTQGLYLTLNIRMPLTLVPTTKGLLSGAGTSDTNSKLEHLLQAESVSFALCNSTSSTQASSALPVAGTITWNSVTVNRTVFTSTSLDASRFTAAECDRIIFYPDARFEKQKQGGYSLQFADSIITTSAVDFSDYSDSTLTFEMLVNLDPNYESGGVLFSFVNSKSFFIESQQTLQISYDGTLYTSNLTLETDTWTKVVIVYTDSTGELDIYNFKSNGNLERNTLALPSGIFNDAGQISLGHWIPPIKTTEQYQPSGLHGSLDNLLVWASPVPPNVISDLFGMNPLDASHLLSRLWTFDEGFGLHTLDLKEQDKFSSPSKPWVQPSWIPSDLEYIRYYFPGMTEVFYSNSVDKINGRTLCSKISTSTETLTQSCTHVSVATQSMFYLACEHAYSAIKSTAAYNILITYAQLCDQALDQNIAVTNVCNQLSSTEKHNTICNTTCLYGDIQLDGTCTCATGYFGNNCENACPGSSLAPCNNHGICTSTGVCECKSNWLGSNSCSSCTSGLFGEDCNILSGSELKDSSNKNLAHITGGGYYLGFNGYQISLDNITGIFSVFNITNKIEVQVYQINCHIGVCVIAAGIITDNDNLVIMKTTADEQPMIYKNGSLLELNNLVTVISSSIQVTLISNQDMKITVTVPDSVEIHISMITYAMEITIATDSSTCSSTTGILEACGSGTSAYIPMNTTEFRNHIQSNYEIGSGVLADTLYGSTGVSTGNAGFSLEFNDTAASTSNIAYGTSHLMTNFSVSIYFKPYSTGGVLMSHGVTKSFAIYNTNPISLQCGTSTISSNAGPTMNEWNQIILTFNTASNMVSFYHYGSNTSITYQSLTLNCQDIFLEGGSISLGQWTPSVSDSKITLNSTFEGMIDEVSIWQDPISTNVVFQAHSLDIRISGFAPETSTMYYFSAGVGNQVFDNIYGNNLFLPKSPWASPSWKVSDLDLKVLKSSGDSTDNLLINETTAISFCEIFYKDVTVTSSCSGLGSDIFVWYKYQCSAVVSSTGNYTYGIESMTSLINICAVTGVDVTSIYTVLCELNVTLPSWIINQCLSCKFGSKSGSSCECGYGFYGPTCGNVCPGGFTTPCSDQGTCDSSGVCQCRGHWTAADCSSCQSGWTGEECIILSTGGSLSTANLTAQINTLGQAITFDGIAFDILIKGVHKLYANTAKGVTIHAYISDCTSSSTGSLCLNAVAIEIYGVYYAVRLESYEANMITLFTTTSQFNVYTAITTGSMVLTREAPLKLSIGFTDSTLALKLTFIDSKLMMTLSFAQSEWTSSAGDLDGLLMACHTENAIKWVSCPVTREEMCSGTSSVNASSTCSSVLTYTNLDIYIKKFLVTDTTLNNLLDENMVVSDLMCLQFTGTLVFVENLILPSRDVTFELYVKFTAYGGVIMCYNYETHFIAVINEASGIVLLVNDVAHQTEMVLNLNEWNQISVVWKPSSAIVEVYVIYTNKVTVVKAIHVSAQVFTSNGQLTLGGLPPEVSSSYAVVSYAGLIDEVRVWDRVHNPSVVKTYARMKVSTITPDLSYAWAYNDGTGVTANEIMKSKHMYMKDINNSPVWVESDLDLTDDPGLRLPDHTSEVPLNDSISTAICDSLLQNGDLVAACSSVADAIISAHAQCTALITATGDSSVADAIALSTAEYCQSVQNLASSPANVLCNSLSSNALVTTYGAACDQTCVQGTVTNDQCVCNDGYYGVSCEGVCDMGTFGPCNSQGQCNNNTGLCLCGNHFLGSSVSVRSYWEYASASLTVTTSSASCSICSDGWSGQDCGFSVEVSSLTAVNRAGFLFGSYVTTLDGASYYMHVPGVYTALTIKGVSIQVLYWPCPGVYDCRRIKELAFVEGSTVVSIIQTTTDMQVFTGSQTEKVFPVSLTVGSISITWDNTDYVKVTVDSTAVYVTNSSIGLICRFKVSAGQSVTDNGLLGNADGIWFEDLLDLANKNITNATLAEDVLTTPYVGEGVARSALVSDSVHLLHPLHEDGLSASGFLLRLVNQSLIFENVYSTLDLSSITISFWIRVKSTTTGTFNLITFKTASGDIEINIINRIISVEWGQVYSTEIVIGTNVWTYLTLTWSSTDGNLMLYSMVNNQLNYKSFSSVNLGISINVYEIIIIGSNNFYVDYDFLRIWSVQMTLDAVIADIYNYHNTTGSTLVALAHFDEGEGQSTNITVHSGSTASSISGTITGDILDNTWVPSNIPVYTFYPKHEVIADNTNPQVINECLEALNHTSFKSVCPDMNNLGDFLLEACIMEYPNLGNTTTNDTLVHSLIFYCQTVLGVDDCEFDGYFDYCQKSEVVVETGMTMILIIVAVCVGVLLIAIFIACLICCHKKKKPKHCEDDDDDDMASFGSMNFGSQDVVAGNQNMYRDNTLDSTTSSKRVGTPGGYSMSSILFDDDFGGSMGMDGRSSSMVAPAATSLAFATGTFDDSLLFLILLQQL